MNLFELLVKIGVDDQASKNISNIAGKLGNGLKTAAKVGVAAVATVTAAAGAMTAAFVKGTSEVAQYGDNIDKMSQKMGLSAEAYQEWDFIMQHSGTSMESLKASMKTLANAVDSGNDAFQRLGISQNEIASLNQEELFAKTIEQLQKVENETERTYLAGQLLGRGATELGALLNTSAEDTEAMRQQVHELGGVMSNEAVKAAAAYQDSLQNMQTAFSGIRRGMLSEFLPSMVTVMDGLALIFSGNDSGIAKIAEGVNQFTNELMKAVPKIFKLGGGILSSLATAILDNLPILAEAAVSVIQGLVDGISQNSDLLVEAFFGVFETIVSEFPALIESFTELIPELLNSILEQLPGAIETIISALTDGGVIENLTQAVVGIVQAIANNLPNIIQAIVDAIPRITESVNSAIIGNFPQILDAIIQIVLSIIENLPTIIEMLVEQIGPIVSTIVQVIVENLPAFIEGIVQIVIGIVKALPSIMASIGESVMQIFKGIGTGLANAWPKFKEGISQIWDKVTAWFAGLWSKTQEIGKNIIEGIRTGISNAWASLKSWFEGLFGDLIGVAKRILGIASPSKVFKKIGGFTAEGFGAGFDDEFAKVRDDMKDAMSFDDVSVGINSSIRKIGAGAAGMSYGGTSIGNITINIDGARYEDEQSLAAAISEAIQNMTDRRAAVYA